MSASRRGKLGLALGLGLLGGCQSFGALSTPRTQKAGSVRLGAAVAYHDFAVSDEKVHAADFQLTGQVGVTDRTELDLLLYPGGIDARAKHNFLGDGMFDLSLSAGAGAFTAFQSNTSSLYAPVDLVGGLRLAGDTTLFAGPKLYGALSVDPPGRGAGFNRGNFGLLVGGVAGLALESPAFSFIPQVTVMTPVATGAEGRAIQVSLGFGTNVR